MFSGSKGELVPVRLSTYFISETTERIYTNFATGIYINIFRVNLILLCIGTISLLYST
jgi:hypothetical protein